MLFVKSVGKTKTKIQFPQINPRKKIKKIFRLIQEVIGTMKFKDLRKFKIQ